MPDWAQWYDKSQGGGYVLALFIAGSFLVGWLMDRYECWSLVECLTRGEPWR